MERNSVARLSCRRLSSSEPMADAEAVAPARRKHRAISPERFSGVKASEEFLNELTCALCLHVLTDPHALPCQHCFCKACVVPWLQKANSCPVCSSHARVVLLRPVRKVARLIACMEFSCEHHSFGCPTALPLAALQDHELVCQYQPRVAIQIVLLHCSLTKLLEGTIGMATPTPDGKDCWTLEVEPNVSLRQQLKRDCQRHEMRRTVFVNRRTGRRVKRQESPAVHGVRNEDVFYACMTERDAEIHERVGRRADEDMMSGSGGGGDEIMFGGGGGGGGDSSATFTPTAAVVAAVLGNSGGGGCGVVSRGVRSGAFSNSAAKRLRKVGGTSSAPKRKWKRRFAQQ